MTRREAAAALTSTERAILAAVTRSRGVWARLDRLPAHDPADLAALIDRDLAVLWQLPEPEGLVLTLTPWGAIVCEVSIHERIKRDGDGYIEEPYWDDDDAPELPLVLPRHAHETRLLLAHLIPSREPNPAELVTDDEGEVLVLFGQAVRRDRRIKPASGGRPTRRAS